MKHDQKSSAFIQILDIEHFMVHELSYNLF